VKTKRNNTKPRFQGFITHVGIGTTLTFRLAAPVAVEYAPHGLDKYKVHAPLAGDPGTLRHNGKRVSAEMYPFLTAEKPFTSYADAHNALAAETAEVEAAVKAAVDKAAEHPGQQQLPGMPEQEVAADGV
jgi:hypothetical protein